MFDKILSRSLGKSTRNNDDVSGFMDINTNISETNNELLFNNFKLKILS